MIALLASYNVEVFGNSSTMSPMGIDFHSLLSVCYKLLSVSAMSDEQKS